MHCRSSMALQGARIRKSHRSTQSMQTQPIHGRFGVEVLDVNLNEISQADYPGIRALFEQHSLLLFRQQEVSRARHREICGWFGPLEDRSQGQQDPDPKDMGGVTNVMADGSLAGKDDLRMLNLRANMLKNNLE